jgi:hypothetical protein
MVSASGISLSIAVIGGFALFSYLLFLIWMAADAVRSGKFLWLIFILGLPLVGVIIYFFVEKEHDYLKLSQKEEAK